MPLARLFLLLSLLATIPCRLTAQTPEDRAGWKRLAEMGDGFVVWESNREGAWRIWRRELNGSGERRLSPDEKGRDHAGAAISPDGAWIAYISLPAGAGYDMKDPSPLRLMKADGTDDRLLSPRALRIPGGNRTVVWVDRHTLLFLDGSNRACLADLRSVAISAPLLEEPGLVPNPALTYVFDRNHIHPFNASSREVRKTGPNLDGCEPTFTSDSRWSVRVSGAGGPIGRVDPATSRVHPLLRKDDPRMPKDRAYLYFPHVSPCRRLMAFSASPNQHDHFKSDYDVFVAAIDPDSLEVQEKPVRYTFDGKTDRYPHVFLADLPLGRHEGEAPLPVRLESPDGKDVRWASGDGASRQGRVFAHEYAKAGRYTVTATDGTREWKGQVTVQPGAPPSVVSAGLAGADAIRVEFDEPVETNRYRARLASGLAVKAAELSPDGRVLTLVLAEPAREKDELRLAGIQDRAAVPHEMSESRLPIERARWPVAPENLLFVFQSGDGSAWVRTEGRNDLELAEQRWRGLARFDRNRAAEVSRGALLFPGAGPRLSRLLQGAREFTFEAVVRSAHFDQKGPARIVTLSRNTGERNFTLGQERNRLVFRLRTIRTGPNGTNPDVQLGPLEPEKDIHVMVVYRASGELVAYRDGKETVRTTAVAGAFVNWEEMELLLGDELTGDRDWRGRVEAVALYKAALSPEQARLSAEAWRMKLAARKPVRRLTLATEVTAVSPAPTLQQIAPYREGLMLAEHRVVRAEGAGAPVAGAKIRVAHWGLLDGKPAPLAGLLKPGASLMLEVEPFDDQPQVKALYLSDELDIDPDAPMYLDVTPER